MQFADGETRPGSGGDDTVQPPSQELQQSAFLSGVSGVPARFGAYAIVREIARGGQGALLEARHVKLGTPVALKILLHPTRDGARRFADEARILARLRHENLPRVTDLGDVGGVPFLAMELVRGRDLKTWVDQDGLPSAAEAVRVLAIVADVLHYCHHNGIVHRDVKPANILLEDGTGRPLLVDFGLVKRDREKLAMPLEAEAGRISRPGETKGTPSFIAPEQVDESIGEIGPWTDVHGLGATLYYLLTERAPFAGSSSANAIVKALLEPPPNLRALNPNVPSPLEKVCLKALAKEPRARYATAAELASALRGAVASRRSVARIAALVVAALLIGVGVALQARWDRNTPSPAPPAPSATTPTSAAPSPSTTPPPVVTPFERRCAEAERMLDKFHEFSPSEGSYVVTQGWAKEAASAAEAALKIDPRAPRAILARARAHDVSLELEEAARRCVELIETGGEDPAAYEACLLRARLPVAPADAADSAYTHAITRWPDRWEAYTRFAKHLAFTGRRKTEAERIDRYFRRALELAPEEPEALRNMGMWMWDEGSQVSGAEQAAFFARGERYFEQALARDPNDVWTIDLRSKLYEDMQRLVEVDDDYDAVVRLFPQLGGVTGYFYWLGCQEEIRADQGQPGSLERCRIAMYRVITADRRHHLAGVILSRVSWKGYQRDGTAQWINELAGVLPFHCYMNRRCGAWELAEEIATGLELRGVGPEVSEHFRVLARGAKQWLETVEAKRR